MADQCPATRQHTPLYRTGTYGLQCKFTKGHDGDHCGTMDVTGDVFWPQETTAEDRVSAEADRIREVMADAQANPGRIISR